jgi:hypothetical protein
VSAIGGRARPHRRGQRWTLPPTGKREVGKEPRRDRAELGRIGVLRRRAEASEEAATGAAPLRAAWAAGYRVAILQASDRGYPVHRRLGFVDQFSLPIDTRRP